MSNFNIGLSADSKTAYVTVLSDTLPAEATNVLTDFTHAKPGATETADGVHDHPENHVLYHDVQDALYRQEGIQNMQAISIVVSKALAAESLSATPITINGAGTATIAIKYQPADVAAVNADFTYVASDPTKATVNASGVVTRVAAGSSTVTATHKHTGAVVVIPVTTT